MPVSFRKQADEPDKDVVDQVVVRVILAREPHGNSQPRRAGQLAIAALHLPDSSRCRRRRKSIGACQSKTPQLEEPVFTPGPPPPAAARRSEFPRSGFVFDFGMGSPLKVLPSPLGKVALRPDEAGCMLLPCMGAGPHLPSQLPPSGKPLVIPLHGLHIGVADPPPGRRRGWPWSIQMARLQSCLTCSICG